MKNSSVTGRLVVLATIAVLVLSNAEAQPNGNATVESSIRQGAQEFVDAFDRGDAAALAKHFATDGVYVNEEGERFEGRQAIQKEYELLFASSSNVKLKLEIDSIRSLNATTVLEEGRIALTPQPIGSVRVMSAYDAVHTLQDGKWLMAHVRDTRIELPTDRGRLDDLDWLVGTWSAANDDVQVEVKGRWIENNHYLARTHSVTQKGKVTSTGLEVIGVDPSTGQITSWSFTSDGGLAIGRWVPGNGGWVVESVGATGGGLETVATTTLSRKGDDTLVWASVDRFAGDMPLPDLQAVTLKRQ